MYIYVRSTGEGDARYHWCLNCPHYPTLRMSHSTPRRPLASLCPECERRERENACEE
jgi:hypothetical protein